MKNEELITKAKEAAENSYSPYSGFTVGAALLTKSGKVYTGCNIENSAFGPTNCAERTAFFKAISEGERDFEKIAVVGGKNLNFDRLCPPCGVCRQVMAEFCDKDFTVILAGNNDGVKELTLAELLPYGFANTLF